MVRVRTYGLVGMVILAGAIPVRADEPDGEVARLIAQLASPKFAEREAAEQKLVTLGPRARPALRTGAASPDVEVAGRCKAALARIGAAGREAFVARKADWPGPVAKRFRELVGDSEDARKLFAEVLASDARAALLETLTDTPEAIGRAYQTERKRVEDAAATAFRQFQGRVYSEELQEALRKASREAVQKGDVALVLFLGTVGKTGGTEPDRRAELLSASFIDLAHGPLKEPFVKLFLAWLDRQTDPMAMAGGLDGALYVPLPAVAATARRVLADPKVPEKLAGKAILVLGHHGKADDLPLLDRFRTDDRSARDFMGRPQKPDIRVRDLAAAMSLTLRGEDPEMYGFDVMSILAWWCGPKEASCRMVGYFNMPAERDEAQKKAWAWLDERAKKK